MDKEPICDCDFGCDCGAGDYTSDEHKPIFRRVQDLDVMFLNGLLFVKRESLESLLMMDRRMNDLLAIKTQTVIISEPAEHSGYYFLWDEASSFLFAFDGGVENAFYYEVMKSSGDNEFVIRAAALGLAKKHEIESQYLLGGGKQEVALAEKRYKDGLRRLFLEFMEEQGE